MRLALAAVLLLALAAGCGDDDDASQTRRPEPREQRPTKAPEVARSRCPKEAGNCRTARGRVLYVEAVDPDGDGDAHLVLLSDESVTGPGISVIDVKRSLRPRPLPRPGDLVSAAGPVFRGSYDQRQIEAVELHVASR